MDTRQLEYFVTVADEGSFTRAAARLFAAQSTVSAGIRALERDLGALLIDRKVKAVTLTSAGIALLPEARLALEGIDRARSAVALTGGDLRGRLRIGTFIALDAIELPVVLGEFHRRHPLVDMHLIASPSGSTGLLDDVRFGRADVAFMGLPPREVPDLNVAELARSRFVAVLPEDHPLARQESVTLHDLSTERWIDAPRGYASRTVLDRLLATEHLDRAVLAETADAGEIPRLVAAGLGVAAIPEMILRPAPGAVTRPLDAAHLELVISVVTRPNPSPAAQALVELMVARAEGGSAAADPSDNRRSLSTAEQRLIRPFRSGDEGI